VILKQEQHQLRSRCCLRYVQSRGQSRGQLAARCASRHWMSVLLNGIIAQSSLECPDDHTCWPVSGHHSAVTSLSHWPLVSGRRGDSEAQTPLASIRCGFIVQLSVQQIYNKT